MRKFTHVDPLEVFGVTQVNRCIAIDRVNAVEDNGKGGAAPDKGEEEEDVQKIVLYIDVHVHGEHLQTH